MLQLQHISKTFPGVKALQDVSLAFNAGEVHAICGENGAGKSTLMHIIAGHLQPDEGAIFWKNQKVTVENIQQAQALGIGIVYQERSLVDSLSVTENIFPINQPKNRWGFIDYPQLFQRTASLLRQLGISALSPKTIVSRLGSAEKQMVEIAKALAQHPSLLILDEPTASITHQETETLFNIVAGLKQRGVAVVYISHRMGEIKKVADVVSVLKDGTYQGTMNAKTTPVGEIVKRMVGRDVATRSYVRHAGKDIKLEVQNLSGKGFHNISFNLHKGEILGFAGLLGSGRTELARALFGDLAIEGGKVSKNGKAIRFSHPDDAIRQGIAYVPDDRKTVGLFLEKTIAENIAAATLNGGLYQKHKILQGAERYRRELAIKAHSVNQVVRNLSGGNQQKVVIAKWLNKEPDILLFNEPTHGVDVSAKGEIYSLLKGLTAQGKSILMISSELPELLLVADRIAVLYNGHLRGIIKREEATEEALAALASGI